jgi:hypothetical protein
MGGSRAGASPPTSSTVPARWRRDKAARVGTSRWRSRLERLEAKLGVRTPADAVARALRESA